MTFTPEYAIVTASDSGIGRATAVALAEQGMDVGITWHSDAAGAEQTAEEVRSHGRRAVVAQLDTSQLDTSRLDTSRLDTGQLDAGRLDTGGTRDDGPRTVELRFGRPHGSRDRARRGGRRGDRRRPAARTPPCRSSARCTVGLMLPPARPAPPDESALVARLRQGDSRAFRDLVTAHQASLLRLASTFVPSMAVAEEVVQETWIAVIRGIDRFEQRSALKTWITRILVNIARTKGVKERRTVPMGSLLSESSDQTREHAVSPDRFVGPAGRGVWAQPPARWSELPEEVVLSGATVAKVIDTVRLLPEQQKWVVRLRDVEDWSSSEVCEALGLTEVNQRVLLHRGRSTLRNMLERQLGEAS
jgi:RNA polymerase sigma-70 factor (ECF subfamily)